MVEYYINYTRDIVDKHLVQMRADNVSYYYEWQLQTLSVNRLY